MDEQKKKPRGWYAAGKKPPCEGEGSATVEPIRSRMELARVKGYLAKTGNQRDRALFICGINFGLRGGDLLSLKWKDVLTSTCHIRGVIKVTEEKTGKVRGIHLGVKPRKELGELWKKLVESGQDPEPDDYVFASRKGRERMSIQRLHQLVNEWCRGAGVKGHFGSHTLRKTFGYFAYKQGTSLALLMELFGHSSEKITLRYIGITEDDKASVYLRLNL